MTRNRIIKNLVVLTFMFGSSFACMARMGEIFQDGNVYYKVTSESSNSKTVDLIAYGVATGYDGAYQFPDGDFTIPAQVTSPKGVTYTVTQIGYNVFSNCLTLKSLVIPKTITAIDREAFNDCLRLTSITLEDSEEVLYCEENWLHDVENLETIYYGRNIYNNMSQAPIQISSSERALTNLQSVVIGNLVTSEYAPSLYQLPRLNELKIGKGITVIPRLFIYECPELKTLSIPSTVEEIVPFSCVRTPLESLTLEDGDKPLEMGWDDYDNFDASKLEYLYFGRDINGPVVWHNSRLINKIVVGDMVTQIPRYFVDSECLKEITLGKNVRIICEYGISGSILENIYLNEGLEVLEQHALNSPIITSLTLPSTLKRIGERALPSDIKKLILNGDNLEIEYNDLPELCDDAEWFTIPSGVTRFCANTPKITGLKVENGHTEIIELPYCEKLECIYIGRPAADEICAHICKARSAILGGEMREVPKRAFYKAESLEELTINEGIEIIGEDAFQETRGLKTIHLPSTLKRIEESAFWFTGDGQNIYLAATTPPVFEGQAWDIVNMYGSTLHVPRGCKELYENSEWKYFNIEEYDVAGTSVVNGSEVGNHKYFNLDGTEIDVVPEKGIYIERTGTRSAIIIR